MSNQTQQEARAEKWKQLKQDTLQKKRELEEQIAKDKSWKDRVFFWRTWSMRAQRTVLVLLVFIALSIAAGVHYRVTGGEVSQSLDNSRNTFIHQLEQSAAAE